MFLKFILFYANIKKCVHVYLCNFIYQKKISKIFMTVSKLISLLNHLFVFKTVDVKYKNIEQNIRKMLIVTV